MLIMLFAYCYFGITSYAAPMPLKVPLSPPGGALVMAVEQDDTTH